MHSCKRLLVVSAFYGGGFIRYQYHYRHNDHHPSPLLRLCCWLLAECSTWRRWSDKHRDIIHRQHCTQFISLSTENHADIWVGVSRCCNQHSALSSVCRQFCSSRGGKAHRISQQTLRLSDDTWKCASGTAEPGKLKRCMMYIHKATIFISQIVDVYVATAVFLWMTLKHF